MIHIDGSKLNVKGNHLSIMSEMSLAISQIALAIATEKEVCIDVVIGDMVSSATLGKYKLTLVKDGQ